MTVNQAQEYLVRRTGYQWRHTDDKTAAWQFQVIDVTINKMTDVLVPFTADSKKLNEIADKLSQYFDFFKGMR